MPTFETALRKFNLFSQPSDNSRRTFKSSRIFRDTGKWTRLVKTGAAKFSSIKDGEFRRLADRIREASAGNGLSLSRQAEFCGLVAEAIFRTQGFRLYDVQLRAIGAAMGGNIVEMQTGEGKTVVTGAIAAVKTLNHASVHVGTTNPYLAARDLESLSPAFELLGITSGVLPEESDEQRSRRAYRNQIVYGPGYQYGFDYLRDQMFLRRDRRNVGLGRAVVDRIRGSESINNMIQPLEHGMALIDEADSVMIDEAMTPLIISLPSAVAEDPTPFLAAKKITPTFVEGEDYTLEMPSKKITVTDSANDKAHAAVENQSMQLSRPWRIYIANAIRAVRNFQRDIDYVVVDEKVQIVDPHTGRIAPDRTWQDGLHQAIEAKENVPIQPGRESTTQITRQRYLQLYQELAGLTGTASTVAHELKQTYGCRVVQVQLI